MQVTDEMIDAALDAYDAPRYAPCEKRMRAALEAALGSIELPLQHDIDRHLKILSEKEACIQELTEALKPVAALTFLDEGPSGQPVPRLYDAEIIRRARATLEQWGLK